jgi:hypothetical protein
MIRFLLVVLLGLLFAVGCTPHQVAAPRPRAIDCGPDPLVLRPSLHAPTFKLVVIEGEPVLLLPLADYERMSVGLAQVKTVIQAYKSRLAVYKRCLAAHNQAVITVTVD